MSHVLVRAVYVTACRRLCVLEQREKGWEGLSCAVIRVFSVLEDELILLVVIVELVYTIVSQFVWFVKDYFRSFGYNESSPYSFLLLYKVMKLWYNGNIK